MAADATANGKSMGERLAPLLTPLTIRSLTLPNRFVMAPMTREFSPQGVPGADVAGYYRRRAEGGVGLIVTEGTGIDAEAAIDGPAIPTLADRAAQQGWRDVVAQVHDGGGRIFPQLWHQGPLRDSHRSSRPDLVGHRPSGLWGTPGLHSYDPAYVERMRAPSEPMSVAQIDDVIAGFVRSALAAVDIGFDGIAIHGAHGYLLDTFLWADTNRRTDRFGGDARARATLAAEVVAAIRQAIGPDMPILFRFSQHKQQDYNAVIAADPDELGIMLNVLAEAGVDVFDASARRFDKPAFAGSDLSLSGWARKLTGRPSMAVGGVGLSGSLRDGAQGALPSDNLDEVVAAFAAGMFDLIGVGRALLADPAWLAKLLRGETPEPFSRERVATLT